MNINKNFRTSSGKDAIASLDVENYKVTGTVLIAGTSYEVTGFAVVQGRKVISIKGAPAPYVVIPNDLYDDLDKICKAQYASQQTPLEYAEMMMREMERRYNKVFADGYDNVAIIKARNEWDRWSDEYHKLLKG
jgi:hypothetical protein